MDGYVGQHGRVSDAIKALKSDFSLFFFFNGIPLSLIHVYLLLLVLFKPSRSDFH